MPDSQEANSAGCKCPAAQNKAGTGTIYSEGGFVFKIYIVSSICPIHTNPNFWLPNKHKQYEKLSGTEQEKVKS